MRTTLTTLRFNRSIMKTLLHFGKEDRGPDTEVLPPGHPVDIHPSHITRGGRILVRSMAEKGYAWAKEEDLSQLELDATGTELLSASHPAATPGRAVVSWKPPAEAVVVSTIPATPAYVGRQSKLWLTVE